MKPGSRRSSLGRRTSRRGIGLGALESSATAATGIPRLLGRRRLLHLPHRAVGGLWSLVLRRRGAAVGWLRLRKLPRRAELGALWRPSWGQKNRFRSVKANTGAKLTFLMKISFQDVFWTDLGPTWLPKAPNMTPKWPPKTTQSRSKMELEK